MTPTNVAKDYEGLKGLNDVAIGAGFLAGVLAALALPTGWGATSAPVIGVLVLAVLSSWGEGYYRDQVGAATSLRFTGRSAREVGLMLLVSAAWLVALGMDAFEPDLPVLLLPLVVAATIYLLGRQTLRHVGLTTVHLAVCLALVVAALLPLVATLDDGLTRVLLSCAVVGVALLATGLTDHLRLMTAVRGRRTAAAGEGA